jgi:ribonuclease J
MRDNEELMGMIRQYLKQKVARTFATKHVDLDAIKKEIKEEVTHILYDQTRRTPIVIPVINEIGGRIQGQARPGGDQSKIHAQPKQNVPKKFPMPQSPDNEAMVPRSKAKVREY